VNYLPETVLLGGNAGAQAFEMQVRRDALTAQVSLRGAGGEGK
jgi:hypothetical protein